MHSNDPKVELAFRGFQTVYTDAHSAATSHVDTVAMRVSSQAASEDYGWMGSFPQLREWVGPRVVHKLKAHGFTIENRDFESTVSISRNDFKDDRLGIYKPMFQEMGVLAKQHPDELLFSLLASGFTHTGYDGQPFFDAAHPVRDAGSEQVTLASNVQDGAGQPWFLLDTSRAIRPLIWQEREAYDFAAMTGENEAPVFFNNELIFGTRARVNAGFGLWQLAYASKAPLDAEGYAAARAAMGRYRADGGRRLGVRPTVLVVPPELEEAGLAVLNAEELPGGGSNVWKGTAALVVTPFLDPIAA